MYKLERVIYMSYLTVGLILILALFAIRFSNRYGIPALLLFIVLGMFFSIGIDFGDYEFADTFATVRLWSSCFTVGSEPTGKWENLCERGNCIKFSGVITTALMTGLFCHYVLGFKLLEGMLIGSIVGSTDYASVSNILRSKNLNLKYNTASLLELESGSNDPTALQ